MSWRSQRKAANDAKEELEHDFWTKVTQNSEIGLQIFNAGLKGRGVKTTKAFKEGEYITRYNGELISYKEACRRYMLELTQTLL